jgi:hypothetical protein
MFFIEKNKLKRNVGILKFIDNIMFFNKVYVHFYPTYQIKCDGVEVLAGNVYS